MTDVRILTTPGGCDGLPQHQEARRSAVKAQFDDLHAQLAALEAAMPDPAAEDAPMTDGAPEASGDERAMAQRAMQVERELVADIVTVVRREPYNSWVRAVQRGLRTIADEMECEAVRLEPAALPFVLAELDASIARQRARLLAAAQQHEDDAEATRH